MLALACASIAVAACCKIWLLAKFDVSAAKLVSIIRPLDACRFTRIWSKLLIVLVSLFEFAPKVPLFVEMIEIALSTKVM